MPERPLNAGRVVRVLSAAYTSRQRGPDGRLQEVLCSGRFGDTILLDPQEEARLDTLGALASPGATRQDVEDEKERRAEAFRLARREIGAI